MYEPDVVYEITSYDANGRIMATYVTDDGGRVANTSYAWTDNGQPKSVTMPSGTPMAWDYNRTDNNSDMDKPVLLRRNGGARTINGRWNPFGPMIKYRHYNKRNGNYIRTAFTWDLAYRPVEVLHEEQTSLSKLFEIDYTHDVQGRVTVRDFTNAASGVQDEHVTYDWLDRVECDSGATGSCPTSGSNLKSNLTAGYTASGERIEMVHSDSRSGDHTYTVSLVTGTDQIDKVTLEDNSIVSYGWDGRGNRTFDDYDGTINDKRIYDHDGRGRTITIDREDYVTPFTLTNVYDERNRRVFRSVYYSGLDQTVHTFFYYDIFDRLIQIKYVEDIDNPSNYQIFEFYWIGDRPIMYYQIDYPGATTTRRYFHSDELNRPLEAWSWPTSGDTTRVWAINPDVFGWDDLVVGDSLYQPLRFPGQHYDWFTWGIGRISQTVYYSRPPLYENRARHYDPFTGTYLSVDPRVEDTWEAYNYAGQNPVMKVDPTGEAGLLAHRLVSSDSLGRVLPDPLARNGALSGFQVGVPQPRRESSTVYSIRTSVSSPALGGAGIGFHECRCFRCCARICLTQLQRKNEWCDRINRFLAWALNVRSDSASCYQKAQQEHVQCRANCPQTDC